VDSCVVEIIDNDQMCGQVVGLVMQSLNFLCFFVLKHFGQL
jgi:hypothetical protein